MKTGSLVFIGGMVLVVLAVLWLYMGADGIVPITRDGGSFRVPRGACVASAVSVSVVVAHTDVACTCGAVAELPDCSDDTASPCMLLHYAACNNATARCTRATSTHYTRHFVFTVDVPAHRTDNVSTTVRCPRDLTGASTVADDPRCALDAGWAGTCYYAWGVSDNAGCGADVSACSVRGPVYAPGDPLVTSYPGGEANSWVVELRTVAALLFALCALTLVYLVVVLAVVCAKVHSRQRAAVV